MGKYSISTERLQEILQKNSARESISDDLEANFSDILIDLHKNPDNAMSLWTSLLKTNGELPLNATDKDYVKACLDEMGGLFAPKLRAIAERDFPGVRQYLDVTEFVPNGAEDVEIFIQDNALCIRSIGCKFDTELPEDETSRKKTMDYITSGNTVQQLIAVCVESLFSSITNGKPTGITTDENNMTYTEEEFADLTKKISTSLISMVNLMLSDECLSAVMEEF